MFAQELHMHAMSPFVMPDSSGWDKWITNLHVYNYVGMCSRYTIITQIIVTVDGMHIR